MKIRDVKGESKCEACHKTVTGKTVKLVEPTDNCKIMTPIMPFIYVDKHGTIQGGMNMADRNIGDKMLACPHCDHVHLFGFDA